MIRALSGPRRASLPSVARGAGRGAGRLRRARLAGREAGAAAGTMFGNAERGDARRPPGARRPLPRAAAIAPGSFEGRAFYRPDGGGPLAGDLVRQSRRRPSASRRAQSSANADRRLGLGRDRARPHGLSARRRTGACTSPIPSADRTAASASSPPTSSKRPAEPKKPRPDRLPLARGRAKRRRVRPRPAAPSLLDLAGRAPWLATRSR